MAEIKRVEITSNDVISESAKSLADFIIEARKIALKEEIRANTVAIDKTFAKVNELHFIVGREVLHIPPMICGLEVHLTDELPDGYNFALVEAPETERERIVRQAKSEVASVILSDLKKQIHDIAVRPNCVGIDAYIPLKVFDAILQSALSKYTEGEK